MLLWVGIFGSKEEGPGIEARDPQTGEIVRTIHFGPTGTPLISVAASGDLVLGVHQDGSWTFWPTNGGQASGGSFGETPERFLPTDDVAAALEAFWGGGSFWVLVEGDRVARLSPEEAGQPIPVNGRGVLATVTGDRALWTVDGRGRVLRYDIEVAQLWTNDSASPIPTNPLDLVPMDEGVVAASEGPEGTQLQYVTREGVQDRFILRQPGASLIAIAKSEPGVAVLYESSIIARMTQQGTSIEPAGRLPTGEVGEAVVVQAADGSEQLVVAEIGGPVMQIPVPEP